MDQSPMRWTSLSVSQTSSGSPAARCAGGGLRRANPSPPYCKGGGGGRGASNSTPASSTVAAAARPIAPSLATITVVMMTKMMIQYYNTLKRRFDTINTSTGNLNRQFMFSATNRFSCAKLVCISSGEPKRKDRAQDYY
ncbi:uncharacterized protein LOC112272310 [Brachypodium distachyon]|uniref:uncharacterized protein LOC112272310 n=1 Tax=Brachypodium distachyon TaxID=15368 RepID=UPI000D0DE0DD|nr:uncharacterized protein LOC112272310 [Brachypodium distachyon]|eukprot:XP_024318494.1 uncharacterized protein LOC112272310 [Brachypodium distachyon]